MESSKNHNILLIALHNLNFKNILIRGEDVIETEQEFKLRVIINDQVPAITWAEVQAKMDELRPVEALKKLRENRDEKLKQTDQYSLPDFPHKSEEVKQAWLTYRQALRDLPANSPNVSIDSNTGELIGITWPVPPS